MVRYSLWVFLYLRASGRLNQAYENGHASKPLHPLGDLDPFTHEPMSADNPEAAVRNAKTKYIMDTVYQVTA